MIWALALNTFHNTLTLFCLASALIALCHGPGCVDDDVFRGTREEKQEKQDLWHARALICLGVFFFFVALKVLVPSVDQIMEARHQAAEMERKP